MGESKQVKVDNWGIFFLQRLQTFFNKTYFCDLTLQFEENVQLKVHRLVLNACTEYFQVLEQTCDSVNDCLIMPPDLQADVVVPIVNFMYSGILEFQIATFDRLYATARLMNMTVLTKLLDAQKVPISPIPKPMNKRPAAPITWNLQGKKITPKTMDPDLPEPLPGRKLPIWKRKSAPVTPHITTPIEFSRGLMQSVTDPLSNKYFRPQHDEPPKPTRFDWPEDDAYDTAPFDEISYTSKPLLVAQTREKSPKPSTSSNFDEVKRSAVKRAASPVYSDSKKVNIQDVKEYIKEQKIRSDYNDYDDSETADNDLQTYDDNDTDDEAQNSEETRGILKNDTTPPHNKRVRFSIEGKENSKTIPQGKEPSDAATIKTTGDVTNHTKIITEVLKKFPQLVQKNKNIRLKILAKGQNANLVQKTSGTPVKVTKPLSKVSYMVHKPTAADNKSANDKKDQQWTCQRCSETSPVHFDTYHAYRLHLTEMHNEKTDSQMCNICGHVSRKQNMLMYHKYVKHNIEPPPIFQFPKCQECPYVALSPSLLIKHQYNHTHQNLVCAECHTAFPNKTDLIRHIQTTGHSGNNNPVKTFNCTQCPKKFISSETLNQHIRNNHEEKPKENIITAEEIDALVEQQNVTSPEQEQTILPDVPELKPKEKKIKILSDIKVNKPISTSRLLPVKQQPVIAEEKIETQQLEQPSSEAESLSNVASGIAASLGLVNTIVVLDENNQFILQDGSQPAGSQQNFILPDNIQNIVSQHQVITTDSNSIITQAGLAKNSIGSTDELVMVLTDHDYSDATNNAVLTSDNSNIVVLYSHPVQGQDGQFISQPGNLMLNSNMGLVEVSNNFGVASSEVPIDKTCDESIEMIQQEINSHLEEEIQNKAAANQQEDVSTVEEHAESPEKMDIDPYESKPLDELGVPVSQEPLPGIQTIATAQKYMFIPTTTHENIHEMQDRIPVIQENIPEMQDNIPEMQDTMPEIQDNIPEMQENIPEMQGNIPEMQDNMPGIQENMSEIQNNMPEIQDNMPEIQDTIPEMQDNLPEMQQNLDMQPEVQENLPEIQENISTVQEDISTVQEDISTVQEDIPKIPKMETTEDPETIPNLQLDYVSKPTINKEIPFDEPMEVEETVEMVQQEINRQQLEREQIITETSISSDVMPETTLQQKLDTDQLIHDTEIINSSSTEEIEKSPGIPNKEEATEKKLKEETEVAPDQIEETIENIEKELKQETKPVDAIPEEEFVEQMEVDSVKVSKEEPTTSQINDNNAELGTEEITSPENFDSAENTEQEPEPAQSENNAEIVEENHESREMHEETPEEQEHISEITELNTTQSTNVDSGIDINQTESETCADVSQLSESESIPQTVDEVSDLPQDTNSSEITEQENEILPEEPANLNEDVQAENVQKINTELSKKPFRISFTEHPDDPDDAMDEESTEKDNQNEEIEVQPKEKITESQDANEETQNTVEVTKEISKKISGNKKLELNSMTKSKISNLLDDWDDGDTDSQQSDTTNKQNVVVAVAKKDSNSINTLINDWEDEED